jgi:hypothetical protein
MMPPWLHPRATPVHPPDEEFEGYVARRLAALRRLGDWEETMRVEEARRRGLELLSAAAEDEDDPD